METGTTSHLDRMGLTNRLCELLNEFFPKHGFDFMEYGQHVIVKNNSSLNARFRKLDIKKSDVALLIKFSPDFILHHKQTDSLFLLDAKTSITPMIFDAAINQIRAKSKIYDLDRHRIGEIEREAWDNYNDRFPPKRVAICFATPYNQNLVLTEWATNLDSLYRYKKDKNVEAGGSGTPHVNIDLKAMRPMSQFFTEEFGVKVDEEMYQALLDTVKEWPLNKPAGRVNWIQFNHAIVKMHNACPWLHGRIPREKPYAYIGERLAELGIKVDYLTP